MNTGKRIKYAIASMIVLTALISSAGIASADELNFSQIDFYLDGVPTLNSDWGSVDFTFTGNESTMYFNLAVNETWQVQNIPVLSGRGVGVEQTMTYYFNLTTPCGTDVTNLNYDYAFTSDILTTMPSGYIPATVEDDSVKLWSGIKGGLMPELEAAKPLVGNRVNSSKKHAHENFPNQECGENECVPAAISNSLKFLNEENDLGMEDDEISIEKMKNATDWDNGASVNWGELKKKYMEDNGYPITTRIIKDMSKLADEIDKGQDVEITETWTDKNGNTGGHATCLIGITELEDGKYSLDVCDDRKQGDAGNGTNNPRTYTYDPDTGKFDEAGFISKFEYAVVECNATIVPDDYTTIQEAVNNAATSDDIVFVRDGTYNENVHVNKNVRIQSENGSANCIIDGGGNGRVVTFSPGLNDTAVLDGFTIRNGQAENGGGIYLYESSPRIRNCFITDCSATGYQGNGGGIYVYESSPTISGCIITSCSAAGGDGGGIYLSSTSDCTISDCNISSNNDTGIYLHESNNNHFNNVTVTSNQGYGCKMHNSNNNRFILWAVTSNLIGGFAVKCDNNTIINTTIDCGGLDVVGVNVSGATNFTIKDCDITNCSCGILFENGTSDSTVNDSRISDNERGICLNDSSNNNITCNWVHDNAQEGFHVTGGSTGNDINKNNIIANGVHVGGGVYHWNFHNKQTNYGIDALNNYWGTDIPADIGASIWEDPGTVEWDPFANTEVPCAPIPELATVVLFSVGLLALAGYVGWRRRKE